jgi:hypothetical protein
MRQPKILEKHPMVRYQQQTLEVLMQLVGHKGTRANGFHGGDRDPEG